LAHLGPAGLEKAEKIWMDGKVVDWSDAHVHLVSNTLQYGFGVFEGIRCYKTQSGPAVFRLKEHLVRLHRSAKILGFEIPYSVEQLITATRQIIHANGFEQCYIRPIAYIGYGGMGLAYEECKINVAIAVWQWGEYVGHGALEKGSRGKVSSYVRQHINTNMSKAKACGNYMLFQMARTEARRDGYDEAILLDSNGHVAEGSSSTFSSCATAFWLRRRSLTCSKASRATRSFGWRARDTSRCAKNFFRATTC
jgi:branched-chain amino acid aminotransferase